LSGKAHRTVARCAWLPARRRVGRDAYRVVSRFGAIAHGRLAIHAPADSAGIRYGTSAGRTSATVHGAARAGMPTGPDTIKSLIRVRGSAHDRRLPVVLRRAGARAGLE